VTIAETLPNGLSVHGLNRNETKYLYKEIFEDEIYVPREGIELPNRPVIWDVGANIGMFTLFAAERWPDARLFSFEPVPRTFEALSSNVGHLANVTVVNMALGDVRQSRQLTFYPRYTMMSGFDADPAADRALVRSYIENVAASLDDEVRREVLIEEADELLEGRFDGAENVLCTVERAESAAAGLGIERIDFLKIDVEGFEVRVLEGIGDELWPRIGNAAVEVEDNDGGLAAVAELFAAHGMRTSVKQPDDYRGTDIYILFATRTP
jgi:FkbM family methyltransferase